MLRLILRSACPLLAAVSIYGCGRDAAAPLALEPRINRNVVECDPFLYECDGTNSVVQLSTVNARTGQITDTGGQSYLVSTATVFFPTDPHYPTDPHIPSDPHVPIIARFQAWNRLIGTSASYEAYLSVLGAIPPNPVIPSESGNSSQPSSGESHVRLRVQRDTDVSSLCTVAIAAVVAMERLQRMSSLNSAFAPITTIANIAVIA